eukprot:4676863-Pleurochrysis_carterae.AAC.1
MHKRTRPAPTATAAHQKAQEGTRRHKKAPEGTRKGARRGANRAHMLSGRGQCSLTLDPVAQPP